MASQDLAKKYGPEEIVAIRNMFDQDVQDWADIKKQRAVDMQCITTDTGDANKVAGPWPEAEWRSRHAAANERPCLHEDVLTQFADQVINDIEQNPMGIEAQPAGEGANPETAQFLENRIRQLENEEQAQIAYLTAAKNAVFGSYGWFKMETAYRGNFDQKLQIIEVDDPDTVVPGFFKKRDASDMRRIWEVERMTHDEFREHYPGARLKAFEGLERDAPKWIDGTTIQVAAFWHFDIDEREMLRIDDSKSPRGFIDVYADEVDSRDFEGRIRERRRTEQKRVVKTIFNGVEALDETEWRDPGDGDAVPPEIPWFFVSGRIKYQNGIRTIDSLIRKGRTGQLIYNYIISSEQEEIAQLPKAKAWGPEGTFDTSTDWRTITRSPVAYAEYKLVIHPDTGQAGPPPEFIQYEPKIQAFELAKQSCLVGIQNAIGMQATERQDRTAKSGKALDILQAGMGKATAHFFGSLRLAQERMYRMLQRILPLIECDANEVAVRDKNNQCAMVRPMYFGRHFVSVSAGKNFQTLQDKQEDLSKELLGLGDPTLLMITLPYAIRMRGVGDQGEALARQVEAIQPPQVQQARLSLLRQGGPSQEALQMQAQMQQIVQALNAQCQMYEQQIGQLQAERQAKIIDNQFQAQRNEADNRTRIAVAEIQVSAKEQISQLEAHVSEIRHVADTLTERFRLEHEAFQAQLDRAHEHIQNIQDRAHEHVQNTLDRTHEHTENELNRAEARARTEVMAEGIGTPEEQNIAAAEGPISS